MPSHGCAEHKTKGSVAPAAQQEVTPPKLTNWGTKQIAPTHTPSGEGEGTRLSEGIPALFGPELGKGLDIVVNEMALQWG